VGKWHLGREPFYPEYQGFDVNIGGNSYGQPLGGYFAPYKNPKLPDGPKGEYLTDRLTDEAISFMRANRDRPFFLYLSHYAPHNPQQAKPELVQKYEAKARALRPSGRRRFESEAGIDTRHVQDHATYAGMIQSLDESVGRVVKELDALGLTRNTCIFFMSDNGGLSTAEGSPTSNLPLRAGKGWLYEGGIREPMIVRWPGAVRAGALCHEPVTSTDFYPTILELAGLDPRPRQHVDGLSLVPLLGGSATLERNAIYWHYPHYSNQLGRPSGAVRAGDFKLIEFYEDRHLELFNLRHDPGEQHDLAGKLPAKAAELETMLGEWRRSVNARMPEANPGYRG
jgi:arylsulfatase A-like enzyme